ncbi:MAG: FemAB family PEP-CTERM system-associated protein [Chlamydiota bacterium]|nr:FemAB family PEP-CTERM system-associated protein [Chlamydiota bacterium]
MNIKLADASDKEEWNAYVNRGQGASVYFLFESKKIIENVFGHKAYYLYAKEDNRIKGVLPMIYLSSRLFGKLLVSLPFWGRGGILADDDKASKMLWESAKSYAFDCHADMLCVRSAFALPIDGICHEHKVSFELDLPNAENLLWDKIGPKTRNQVRKAEKAGLTSKNGGKELLGAFYHVFSRNMRDLGTPVMPYNFFEHIVDVYNEYIRIFIVEKNGNPIGASFCFSFLDKMEVPWASTIKEYNRDCPNMLLYWSMLRHAIILQVSKFDFGRGSKDGGTYHFKKQWGGLEQQHYWYYWTKDGVKVPDLSPGNAKYNLPIIIWRHLPIKIANWLGPKIVKYIP